VISFLPQFSKSLPQLLVTGYYLLRHYNDLMIWITSSSSKQNDRQQKRLSL